MAWWGAAHRSLLLYFYFSYFSYFPSPSLDLSPVVSPLTELHYVHTGLGKGEESRVGCATTALLSLLRSWWVKLLLLLQLISTVPWSYS